MERENDVLIIGGGVIGVCTALQLTRAGHKVTLVDRGELCGEASLGNACWIAAGYALPTAAPGVLGTGMKWLLDRGSPFSIRPRANVDLIRWLLRFRAACTHSTMMKGAETLLELNRQGIQLFRDFAADPDFEFYFEEVGLIHLHLSEQYRRAGEREAELLRSLGIEAISLNRRGLLDLEPRLREGIESGVFFPEHAHIDPHQFVLSVAARAEAEGAEILTGVEVTGARTGDGGVTMIETTVGEFEPRELVLAAGAWSSPLARMLGDPILMEPAKGYSVTVSDVAETLGPSRPLAIDDSKVAITPLSGNRFRFSSTLELAGFDASVNQRRLEVNRQSLNRVLPEMEDLNEAGPWSGYRPMTPDGLPYIGRSRRLSNLVFATGHGMMGVTHGPITAKLVAEIIGGRAPSIDLEPLRPDRF